VTVGTEKKMGKIDLVKPINARYKKRIYTVLNCIISILEANGWKRDGGISDITDAQFEYEQFMVHPDGRKITIVFEISEASQYDANGPADGVNFAISINGINGEPDLYYAPHNMTPSVWVHADAALALEARFHELEKADWSAVISHLDWKTA